MIEIETFDATPSRSVLIVGTPVDGIRVIGPFDTAQWAADYAECDSSLRNDTWWVTPIESPRKDQQS